MLSNITITNKTTIDPDTIKNSKALLDDSELKVHNTSGINPIMFRKLNARDTPMITSNTLVINIDGKDYIASELSAEFKPGRAPVTFDIKDLIELDSVVDVPLYDVVLNDTDNNVLEIKGGSGNLSYINLFGDKSPEELEELDAKYKASNKDLPAQGFDIGPILLNDIPICLNSLELFTEKNVFKARATFIVSSIKFSGENVTTKITYYQEKDQNLVKYVFKPDANITSDYSDLIFYIDTNIETDESINNKLEEALNNNWKLYSIDNVLVNS